MNCFNSFQSQIAIGQNKNKPWSELGLGVSGGTTPVVYAIHVLDLSNVFVGGNFTSAGGVSAFRIAKWNSHSGSWSPLGIGCNGTVYAIHATNANNIYVGGTFSMAGGVANTNRIARWNGLAWSTVGGVMTGTGVYAIHSSSTIDVYVGGAFSNVMNGASNVAVSNIAKWSGSAWSILKSGVGNEVYTIYAHSSGVYVGGYFTTAGGGTANRIAKWGGLNWSTIGGGCNGPVNAIYVIDANNIFVGGNFTTVDNPAISVNYIAKWNNNTNQWSALGNGCNNYVQTIHALDSNNIFVGGNFNGDLSMNYIAKWNNNTTEWSALENGCNNIVRTIYGFNSSNVFVGGNFTSVGDISMNRVAKWNNGS